MGERMAKKPKPARELAARALCRTGAVLEGVGTKEPEGDA